MKRMLGNGVAVLTASRILALLLGIVMTGLLTRGLTPAEYGTLSLAITLDVFSNMITDLGLSQLLIRDGEHIGLPNAIRTVAVWRTILGTIGGALALIVGLALVNSAEARLALILVLASSPFAGLTVGFAVAQLRRRFDIVAGLLVLQSAAQLAAVAIVFTFRSELRWFALALTAGGFVYGGACVAVTRHLGVARGSYVRSVVAPLLREGALLGAGSVLIYAYHRVDAVVVYAVLGNERAGFYNAAFRIVDQALLIPQAIATVLLPRLVAQIPLDQAGSVAMFVRQRRAAVLVGSGIAAVLTSGAEPILGIALGNEYTVVAPQLLKILAPSLIFMSFTAVQIQLIIVSRGVRSLFIGASVILLVNAALLALTVPHIGLTGAAFSTLATEMLAAVVFARVGVLRAPLKDDARTLTEAATFYGGAAVSGLIGGYFSGSALVGALVSVATAGSYLVSQRRIFKSFRSSPLTNGD